VMEQNAKNADLNRTSEISAIAQTCASVLSSIVGTMCSADSSVEISAEEAQPGVGACVIALGGSLEEKHALALPSELQSLLLKKLIGEEVSAGLDTGDPAVKGALREVVTQLAAAWSQHYSDALGATVGVDAIDVVDTAPDVKSLGAGAPVGIRFSLGIGSDNYPITIVVGERVLSGIQLTDTEPTRRSSLPPEEEPETQVLEPKPAPQKPEVAYQPVEFRDLTSAEPVESGNLELLLDVPLVITVELGRAKTNIKSILGYGQGSLLTLDKLAGEQVDLLVNGKPFARGEVVVVDENFGVRITSILTPEERVQQLINE
jgi:flagellar motor switch protein FliN